MCKGGGSEVQTGNKSFSYECQLEMRGARQRDKQAARRWYKDWEKCRKKGGRAKEEGGWNTSYRVVWCMATGSINPSILPTHPLLLFTAPKTFLKTNLEKQKYLFRLQPDPWGFQNYESWVPKCQSCKGVGVFSQVQEQQHQHFNICLRSALAAHSSQLSSECLSCSAL